MALKSEKLNPTKSINKKIIEVTIDEKEQTTSFGSEI